MTTDKELKYEIEKIKKIYPVIDINILDDLQVCVLVMASELKGRQEARKEVFEKVEKILNEYLEPDYPDEHSAEVYSLIAGIKQRINNLKEK